MNPIIEVIVLPTGEARIETKGFAGPTCQEASRFLETALGTRGQEHLTAEYFQQARQDQPIRETQ
jgi:hypothetical protein